MRLIGREIVAMRKLFNKSSKPRQHYSLDGRGRGSAAGHAGVGGVRPGPPVVTSQPGQQRQLRGAG